MTDNPSPTRAQRAATAADALIEAHGILMRANDDGALNDVCDHVARLARQARETARMALDASRR
ncbi:MAG: hypothetical protein Q7W51_05770 [Coriobacteriia bacterium]|nr:hypothetical protein [Coriobacteriia bacterium]